MKTTFEFLDNLKSMFHCLHFYISAPTEPTDSFDSLSALSHTHGTLESLEYFLFNLTLTRLCYTVN